ncbi:uncharacterized protein FOMMEDRAFT_125338 [Fomitiporia mediterranea MF3/22]|uniref:uncharacterized protein n=1 Tax=Fomitiporia mediterranea (strain MF3/22) TaxID=694068 RepID=UPI0004407BDB|nr:uncharacterized protein FOMMEDRAFT_125338 [Fomitiporia mediterranea MF3/22]EJD00862.1 hypothetical protein FOMMEDRAFT_125338 [Fomitiporia mediterranea MF3/22]
MVNKQLGLDLDETEAGPSHSRSHSPVSHSGSNRVENDVGSEEEYGNDDSAYSENGNQRDELEEGLDPEGFAGPSQTRTVQPLTPEALAAFRAAQGRAGVIYISRIPPGMRPTKVRHLMSQHGEVGRVYLQQEDPKRAYLRKKYTSTKKANFTEGWVEFADKRVARSVAEMLNAQPIGGKKGTRWRDDVWTMKYLPKFKWNMLTEQIANEAAIRTARLRVELEQSRREQKDYLRQVELARVLDKRAKRKREALEKRGERVDAKTSLLPPLKKLRNLSKGDEQGDKDKDMELKRKRRDQTGMSEADSGQLEKVLGSVF